MLAEDDMVAMLTKILLVDNNEHWWTDSSATG